MQVTNAGENTSKEVIGPRGLQDLMDEKKAERKRELAAQNSVFGKIKRLFKKSK